jgi:hypothetical protein
MRDTTKSNSRIRPDRTLGSWSAEVCFCLKGSNRSIFSILVGVLLLLAQSLGAETTCLPVHLKPVHCACGVVIDQSGAPIDGATVTLFKDGKALAVVHGQQDGKFSFDVSQSGSYEIQAQAPLFFSVRFPVTIIKPRAKCKQVLKILLGIGNEACSRAWLAKH